MKNLSLALILAGMVVIAVIGSCKKDDNGTTLIGRWAYIPSFNFDYLASANQASLYLQFNNDGTIAGNYFNYVSYKINSNDRVAFTLANGNVLNYTYTIKQDTLTLGTMGDCIDDCRAKFVKVDLTKYYTSVNSRSLP